MNRPIREVEDTEINGNMTGNEAVARQLIRTATKIGSFTAIEMILDRIEGKPTKAAANKPDNSQLTDQLDLTIDSLNDFTKE